MPTRDDRDEWDDIPEEPRPARRRRRPADVDDFDADDDGIREYVRVDRGQLRRIATYQRYLLFSLLANVAALVGLIVAAAASGPRGPNAGPEYLALGLLGVWAVAVLASVVCMFLMSNELFGPAVATLLALLTLLGCVGIIALVVVNQVATNKLKAAGVRVGFLGADPRTI